MNQDYKEFVKSSRVGEERYLNNKTMKSIFDFLAKPESVARMIIASDLHNPAISGIVIKLEKFIEKELSQSTFLQNTYNRTVIGKAIAFVLEKYGYKPVKNQTADIPSRIRREINYFKTGTVYSRREGKPALSIEYQVKEE